uniref:uncharacterized protein LOC113475042 isoform X2 n=1 Tax=Ciona intestinalis TaxID=7719 RepID=UPI000EF47BED|nr:uncharacterized protein LOC113475042 isoform X2 [Ciona intestinalis]|eukprot:XP_026694255.1 uncharacterized protein LOC113475042 isoform X2 [Ciona intestinalis]
MGINVSRGSKKVLRHDDVTTSRNTNLRHRYGQDIRKRALQAEYEAWLRSLGSVDHVGEGHEVGGQGKSLFRKVTSLLSSKQHRKTPIVWPHDVRKGDVIPKIRLSFAESKNTRKLPPLPRRESKKEINSFAPPSDEEFYSWSFQSSGTDKRGQRWDQRPRDQPLKKETSDIAKSGYPERRHTWEIPFDYNAIQGSSCIVGPKVLPTLSPSSGYHLATSGVHKANDSSTTNRGKRSRDQLDSEIITSSGGSSPKPISLSEKRKLKRVINEMSDDFRRQFIQKPTVVPPHTTVDSPQTTVDSPQTTVDSAHTAVDSPHTTVDSPHTTVDSPHTTVDSPHVRTLNFGPGSENFFLLGSIKRCRERLRPVGGSTGDHDATDDVMDDMIHEFEPRGLRSHRPNSETMSTPTLLWRKNTMASSMTSMKEVTSPYKNFTDSSTTRGTWSTSTNHTTRSSHQDDVIQDDVTKSSSSSGSFRSDDLSYETDEDFTDQPSDSGYGVPIGYRSSGDRYHGDRDAHSNQPRDHGRHSNQIPQQRSLEDKIDVMVTSLMENKFPTRARQRVTSGVSADVIQDMIERKIASIMTQMMNPKFRNDM